MPSALRSVLNTEYSIDCFRCSERYFLQDLYFFQSRGPKLLSSEIG